MEQRLIIIHAGTNCSPSTRRQVIDCVARVHKVMSNIIDNSLLGGFIKRRIVDIWEIDAAQRVMIRRNITQEIYLLIGGAEGLCTGP